MTTLDPKPFEDAVREAFASRNPVTWERFRSRINAAAEFKGEWQGYPIPVEGFDLVLEDRYPAGPAEALRRSEVERERALAPQRAAEESSRTCHDSQVGPVRVRNSWHSRRRNCNVTLYEQDGQVRAAVEPLAPDRSMERLTMWLSTLGAADAWDEKAEDKAQDKLRTLVNDRQWTHFKLTGTFLETSPRSHVTYLFRRGRPTVAIKAQRADTPLEYIGCLAVLCLHPIGLYYHAEALMTGGGTWAGVMCPTDDLIAHLLWMRGDERGYWARSNQHDPAYPGAGL